MKQFKVGDLVELEFLDHAQSPTRENGIMGPVPCWLVGRIADDEPTYYGITSWVSGALDDPGSDYSVVIKGAITRIRGLK